MLFVVNVLSLALLRRLAIHHLDLCLYVKSWYRLQRHGQRYVAHLVEQVILKDLGKYHVGKLLRSLLNVIKI